MAQEQVKVEKQDREEMFRIITENMSDTVVVVERDGRVRYVSPSIEVLTGHSVEQYENMDAFDVLHEEDRERIRASFRHVVESGVPVHVEYRVQHVQGHIVYVETRVKPVLDDDGKVKLVVAIVRDVTERKQSEQMLESILENAKAVMMSTDKDFTRHHHLYGNVEKFTGFTREAIMAKPILMHSIMHPDDDAYLMNEVKRQLDLGLPVVATVRMNPPEQGTRWFKMTVHPFLDETGAVERIDIISMDVTEKKQSELALEESEQRYKSLFENNLDGVFSIDLDGNIVNGNAAFQQITGIRLDQLPDRCFMGLLFDEDQFSVQRMLFEVMQNKEPRDIECRISRPGQGERIVHITLVPIFFFDELKGVHGIVKDITERKREEMELIRSEERSKFLQMSLNRFSNDLADVMKVSELENRLIDEVKEVLPVSEAAIERAPRGTEPVPNDSHEFIVKIGEKEQSVFLRISIKTPLLKIEEEWLETAVHYVTLLYDNLQLLEDLMKQLEDMVTNKETPKWMLRLLFKLSEKERASLSSDLHDSVLQDLIIWYRKLESLRSGTGFPNATEQQLKQIEEGLLDAIHQIRITCNELRPPFLLKMGLVESLKSLFSYARMFSNYEIEFTAEQEDVYLNEEQILGLYRVVQELLNNASKHSKADKVTMALAVSGEEVVFTYFDDGVGMDLSSYENSFQHMGISGIEKRVQSLEGDVELRSAPDQGFHVKIRIPQTKQQIGYSYEARC